MKLGGADRLESCLTYLAIRRGTAHINEIIACPGHLVVILYSFCLSSFEKNPLLVRYLPCAGFPVPVHNQRTVRRDLCTDNDTLGKRVTSHVHGRWIHADLDICDHDLWRADNRQHLQVPLHMNQIHKQPAGGGW